MPPGGTPPGTPGVPGLPPENPGPPGDPGNPWPVPGVGKNPICDHSFQCVGIIIICIRGKGAWADAKLYISRDKAVLILNLKSLALCPKKTSICRMDKSKYCTFCWIRQREVS